PSSPSSAVPPPCEVPHFSPLRVRGGQRRLLRAVRRRRRPLAAGLAVAAAALAATASGGFGFGLGFAGAQERAAAAPQKTREHAVELVSAPVRIADAGAVRLLRPGDRVDVIAADEGAAARVVAAGARVAELPETGDETSADAPSAQVGALVVLSVPRPTAARLAGAGATARLAVTLC
ncbi:RcpC/CpaB family pilus assembly protein, partial [Streptomyces sp. E11-3]|uniref:RcpC/CpaB family pilus assembly protein n=1 Tax=Streptomyces sp. E11-3 TaxID=3110112 RepID=UPI00398123F5